MNNDNSKIISLSQFSINPEGHGGEKRTAQLREILATSKIDETLHTKLPYQIQYPKFISKAKFRALSGGYRILRQSKLYKCHKTIQQIRGSASVIGHKLISADFLNQYDVLLYEHTRDADWKDILVAKSKGLKVVALPHNLESLVSSQISSISGKISPAWIEEEIEILRICDRVFTISREEQWLLGIYGIEADYLPYYPVKEYENELLKIRKQRQIDVEVDKAEILMVGSASNPPTFEGFKSNLQILRNTDFKVNVVGNQTENLKLFLNKDNDHIKIYGKVSQTELFNFMKKASCLLVNQPPSSGALTRIIEKLVAGIPVLTNVGAARSYHNMKGVYIYESDDELVKMLSRKFNMPPLPLRPINENRRFSDYIESLLNSG